MRAVWQFGKEVQTELLKITWPSYWEVIQTTLIIGVVVLISSFLLWGIDSVILRLISSLLVQQKG